MELECIDWSRANGLFLKSLGHSVTVIIIFNSKQYHIICTWGVYDKGGQSGCGEICKIKTYYKTTKLVSPN